MTKLRERRADAKGAKGYVLVLTAGCLVVLLAAAAFGVDLGAWYEEGVDLQNATDSAALAGVVYMPGNFAQATTIANAALAKHGITAANGYTSSVSAVTGQPTRLKVCAGNPNPDQFFSKIVGANPTISKCATAEYVLPVAMGSPLNIFAQSALGIHAAVSGYCASKEDGDLRQAHSQGNRPSGSGWPNPPYTGGSTCDASPATVNADYRATGYNYIVDIPNATAGSTRIEAWNASYLPSSGSGCGTTTDGCDSASNNVPNVVTNITTILTVYDATNTPLDASDDPVVATHTIAKNNATWSGWNGVYTVPVNGAKRYRIRVQTQAGQAASAGSNSYGLRARLGGSFVQCTTIVGNPGYAANCPQVYAEDDLSIFANVTGSTATFYLADISSVHAGKTMQIQLFDPGEGAQSIEVLDPNGNPVTFSYQNVEGFSPSYSGTTSLLNVSGTGAQPPYRQSPYKFNERKVQINVALPSNYSSVYGTKTWWRLRYKTGSSSVTDRTTWSITIVGDPLRLVPNS